MILYIMLSAVLLRETELHLISISIESFLLSFRLKDSCIAAKYGTAFP